jgi:UDP-glucose 4-epimerase
MRDTARRDEVLQLPDTAGRQFIGASDLARLYVALLENTCNHERFVAVAPEVIPWAEIAARVIEHVGSGRLDASARTPAAASVFDVEKTARTLGPIPSARSALWDALRWHCTPAPRM